MQDEVKYSKEIGFVLNKWQHIHPWSLFGGEISIPINWPIDRMSWPTTHFKHIMPSKMSKQHYNGWEIGYLLEVVVNPPLEDPMFGCGQIYKIMFGESPNNRHYEITIGKLRTYICLDFVTMIASSLGYWKK